MPKGIRLLILGIFLAVSPWLSAQECCKNTSQVCICGVAGEQGLPVPPDAVSIVRLGTLDREPAGMGTMLGAGDELAGTAAGVAVELICPKGSSVKFSDAFRAVVLPSAVDQDCSFSLLSGSADVLTGEPTQIMAGLVVMGSKRTQYALRVSRVEGEARLETLVYEGEAECRVIPRGVRFSMHPGSKALVRGAAWQRTRMSDRDIDRTAGVYARIDLARARGAGIRLESPANVYSVMKSTHARVLRAPTAAPERLELASWQVRLGNPRRALYHLGKVTPAAGTNDRLRAEVAELQGAAYERMGDKERAARHFERAKQIDPQVKKRVEERYQLRREGIR